MPGGNLYFSCKAGGDPPPRLFWRKDGVTLNLQDRGAESNKRERRLVDGSSRLHIYQVSLKHTNTNFLLLLQIRLKDNLLKF